MNRNTVLERIAAARKFDSRADLKGASLSKAYLRKMDLEAADLCQANLWQANLSKANLRDADLEGANLSGANLRGADLSEASLYQADLRGADLRGAILLRADLRQAKLDEAKLSDTALSQAYLKDEDLPPDYYDDEDEVDLNTRLRQAEKKESKSASKQNSMQEPSAFNDDDDHLGQKSRIFPKGVHFDNSDFYLMIFTLLIIIAAILSLSFTIYIATLSFPYSLPYTLVPAFLTFHLLRFLYFKRGFILAFWWWQNKTNIDLATAPLDLGEHVQLYVESRTTRPMAVDYILVELIGRLEWIRNEGQYTEDVFYNKKLGYKNSFTIKPNKPWKKQMKIIIPNNIAPTVKKRKSWVIKVTIRPSQTTEITAIFPIPVKDSETPS